jgi:membrane protease subunit HflK
MAWNEHNKGRNPWNGGNQGPPDLDEYARKLQRRLVGLWRGVGRGGGGGNARGGTLGAGVITAVAVAVWLFFGVYVVDAADEAVVLRFGRYLAIAPPGLQWHIPWPIESVQKVKVASIDKFIHETRMLTADENLVEVKLAIQFRRADPRAYLFNVRDPVTTLSEISESAIREVVGNTTLDFVLGEGRAEIAQRTKDLLQTTLDSYETGLEVTSVNLQDTNFPAQVQASVQDAIKAREDKERQSLEAQSYANDVVPRARGMAARQTQDASAYRERVIADAEGEAARFTALLAEYEKAPEVTRERMYLETVEDVYARSSKVLLDATGSGNLIYLPMDKLLEGQGLSRERSTDRGAGAGAGESPGNTDPEPNRDNPRSRSRP